MAAAIEQRADHCGRAGTLRGLRLDAVVARDRRAHGELAHVIEWPEGTCPRERGDDGPCIHVGCVRHLCSEIGADGSIWIDPRFEADPYSVQTCAIDEAIAHPDGQTLEEISGIFDVTRERIRQIEAKGLGRLEHPGRIRAVEALREIAADAARPMTPLAAMQGSGPSLGGSAANGWGQNSNRGPLGMTVAAAREATIAPCRHPAAPHVAPRPTRSVVAELPPSLAAHAAELRSTRRSDRRHGTDCNRREAKAIAGLHVVDQVEAVEPIPQATVDALVDLGIAPPQLASDNDCNDAAQGREEMEEQMTVSQKIDRLLEIEKEQAALVEEQQRLLADPDVERLIEMLKRMRGSLQATATHVPPLGPSPALALTRSGKAKAGERLAVTEAALTEEPVNYRTLAERLGQVDSDCYARLVVLVKQGKAVKTGPGMFKLAA